MTKYYLTTPFCETFTSREEAAGTIADLFCDQASERGTDARRAFCASCEDAAGDDLEMFGFLIDDDAERMQWAEYKAYDLLDDAGRLGSATLYGVTVYADAETEALEERITDMIDPWCDDECRVATFCDLYNVTDAVSDIIEYIVNELDDPESLDECAARVRLIDDIRAYRKARREKVSA